MSTLVALLITGVVLGSVLAILSLGFAVSYWPSQQFHFAYGSVFVAGSYALWYVSGKQGLPLVVGILASFAVSIVVGLICYFVFYRPLANEHSIFLTSFALSVLIQNLLQVFFSADPRSVPMPSSLTSTAFTISGASVSVFQIVEVVVCLGLWAAVEVFLRRARMGVGLRAISSNRYLTETVGIETGRLLAGSYVIGSALSTVAAVFFALDFGISPDSGTTPLFYAINAVLIGGVGSMTGAAIGGLLLGVVVNLGIWHIPSQWQIAIAFGVLFVILVFRPQGLLAKGARVT